MRNKIGLYFCALILISFAFVALPETSHLYYYVWSGSKISLPDTQPVKFLQQTPGFEAIRVSSGWTVTIHKGSDYRVWVTMPENCRPALDMHIENIEIESAGKTADALVIGMRGGTKYDEKRRMEIDITTPTLKYIRNCGEGVINVHGFAKNELKVRAGAGEIRFHS